MPKKISVLSETPAIHPTVLVQSGSPALNSEIYKFAVDAAQGLHYAFVAAALQQETPFAAGSVEEEFRRGIQSCRPDVRAAIKARASALANAPSADRVAAFGRYSDASVKDFGSKGFLRTLEQRPPLHLDASALAPLIKMKKSIPAADTEGNGGHAKPKIHFPPITDLSFYVTEVRCLDETDGFLGSEAGDDEIVVGGLAVDSAGVTKKANQFVAGTEFDDGDKKVFSAPGKLFCHFDIPKGGKYPKLYSALLMIAESDWGGFAAAVNDAYETAFPHIKKAYEEAIKLVFDTVTPLPSDIGAKIAELYVDVISYAVDFVLNFFGAIVGDDLFGFRHSVVRLHTPVALSYANGGDWKNGAVPIQTMTFTGHGGKYTVKGYWKVESGK